jgi:hypothetical protein
MHKVGYNTKPNHMLEKLVSVKASDGNITAVWNEVKTLFRSNPNGKRQAQIVDIAVIKQTNLVCMTLLTNHSNQSQFFTGQLKRRIKGKS